MAPGDWHFRWLCLNHIGQYTIYARSYDGRKLSKVESRNVTVKKWTSESVMENSKINVLLKFLNSLFFDKLKQFFANFKENPSQINNFDKYLTIEKGDCMPCVK